MSHPADSDLRSKRVAITGAGSGIGAACAEAFARAGAHVILMDVDGASIHQKADALSGTAIELDLSSIESIGALELRADVLVNNAGFQHIAPVPDFPVTTFHKMVTVMLTAPFALAQAVLPGMYDRGWGRIINVSSIHGLRASAFKSAYVSAKHGMEGLSKTIAVEGGGRGVTSNCINPGYVRTPLVENQIAAQAESRGISPADVIEQVMLQKSAVKRLIEPEEVASLALYLCGPAAGMMNGGSITMDGGWTAQ